MRGQGSIYKQRGSNNWHISFYAGGKHFRMSAKTTKKTEARKFLDKKKAEHERHGQLLRDDKVTLRELLDGVVTDYKMNGRRSLRQLKARIKNLLRYFDPATKASAITKTAIKRYQMFRLEEGAAPATINRETAALRRAFSIAHSDEVISRIPAVPKLTEPPPREGFIERDALDRICNFLSDVLTDIVLVAWCTGWRKSEVLDVLWTEIDLKAGTINLSAARSKNGKRRVIRIAGELREVLRRRRADMILSCPFVFHRAGRQIKSMTGAWKRACEKAGCPELIFHDLRRSTARDLRRAGVDETVCMKLFGHLTPSMFRRYSITSTDELADAAERLQRFRQGEDDRNEAASQ